MREKEKQLEFNRRLIERKKREQQIREEQAAQEYELCKLAEDEHANTSSVTWLQTKEMGQIPLNYSAARVNTQPESAHCAASGSQARVTCALFTEGEWNALPVAQDNRVDDWVSTHSRVPTEMDDLQRKARRIMETKERTRQPVMTLRSSLKVKDNEQEIVAAIERKETPLINTGVEHLKRLELVPGGFGKKAAPVYDVNMSGQTGRNEHLCFDDKIDYDVEQVQPSGECACGNTHSKIKSGKFAKSNLNIVRQEQWPHTAVSKKYIKRTSFDALEYEAFVAGETKVICLMLAQGDANGLGRLRVLTLIAHWYGRTKNWSMIKSLYESIMEEIEMGDKEWLDDFSSYETMLPSMGTQGTEVIGSVKGNKKNFEVYWCKAYQMGGCELDSPHMAQIKQDENPVPVLHICAYCWSNYKKRKEHLEMECGAKK